MNLPEKTTKLGRVLRAMHNAGPLTSGEIRRKAKLAPDTAVTARIRDLRKMGIDVVCSSIAHPTDEHKRIWKYKAVHMPKAIREALAAEAEQGVAA